MPTSQAPAMRVASRWRRPPAAFAARHRAPRRTDPPGSAGLGRARAAGGAPIFPRDSATSSALALRRRHRCPRRSIEESEGEMVRQLALGVGASHHRHAAVLRRRLRERDPARQRAIEAEPPVGRALVQREHRPTGRLDGHAGVPEKVVLRSRLRAVSTIEGMRASRPPRRRSGALVIQVVASNAPPPDRRARRASGGRALGRTGGEQRLAEYAVAEEAGAQRHNLADGEDQPARYSTVVASAPLYGCYAVAERRPRAPPASTVSGRRASRRHQLDRRAKIVSGAHDFGDSAQKGVCAARTPRCNGAPL